MTKKQLEVEKSLREKYEKEQEAKRCLQLDCAGTPKQKTFTVSLQSDTQSFTSEELNWYDIGNCLIQFFNATKHGTNHSIAITEDLDEEV